MVRESCSSCDHHALVLALFKPFCLQLLAQKCRFLLNLLSRVPGQPEQRSQRGFRLTQICLTRHTTLSWDDQSMKLISRVVKPSPRQLNKTLILKTSSPLFL